MVEKTNGFNAGGIFAGDNGKAFFDWIGTNRRAQEIFTGLLEEFGKGMGLQNQVAQVQLGNAAVAAAGFRPGQYVSARQRREAIAAATDPDKAAADKLARLQFHGGVANGKWTNNYDEWKAVSKNGHGTNSKGEEIKVKSFGFSVPVSGANAREDTLEFESWKRGQRGQWAKNWAEAKSWDGKDRRGDHRGVRYDEDGMVTYRFGDDRTSQRLAARERIKKLNMLTRLDEYMKQNPELFRPRAPETPEIPSWIKRPVNAARDFLGGLFSASKGGETMRDRGWLDAVFARAERAAMRGGRTRR